MKKVILIVALALTLSAESASDMMNRMQCEHSTKNFAKHSKHFGLVLEEKNVSMIRYYARLLLNDCNHILTNCELSESEEKYISNVRSTIIKEGLN